MLKHRNIVALFIILLAGLIISDQFYPINWAFYLLLILLFLSIEFYGAYFVHSNFHVEAISKVNTNDKIIALTFDDGPEAQTKNVLNVLNEFNAKATFFCIGKKIKGREDILREIDAAGHLIGNHSFSHGNFFDLKTTNGFVNDLGLAQQEIKNAIGKTPVFFRPPYGVTTPGIGRAVKKLNYTVIGWNIRSLDTQIKDQQQLLARITQRIKPGSILLMHDTVHGTELVLRKILIHLKENNYKIVSLNELIQKKAYA